MPTPQVHLAATRAALARLMGADGPEPALAHQLGLSAEAAAALCVVRQPVGRAAGQGLALVFDARGSAVRWPQRLRSPLDGSDLPVRCAPLEAPLRAQAWTRARNLTRPEASEGTLTALLRLDHAPSRLLALTAGHVAAATPAVRRGDRIGLYADGDETRAVQGVLLDWQPNFTQLPGSFDLDAAIAEVDPADAAVFGRLPTGGASLFADDRLRLLTRGQAIACGLPERVTARVELPDGSGRAYLLREALGWTTGVDTEGGDSGAPVWNENDRLVAMHVGAYREQGRQHGVALPITRVLRWAGASVVRQGEPLQRGGVPARAVTPPVLPPVAAPSSADAETDTLARTMFGEARGEGEAGMAAVAHVVFNRVDARSWWGRDVVGVCMKRWQFSCWNPGDPNRERLLRVTGSDVLFRRANTIAAELLAAQRQGSRMRLDTTDGATHYYAPALVATPRWARGLTPCQRIGRHLFFKGVA
jgi:hypothetical protein